TGLRTVFQFNVRNPAAKHYLFERSSTKVTQIIADQRDMIRTFLAAGMEAGNNPRTMALDLVGRVNPATGRREGGHIGLTSSQEAWVRNYRDELTNLDAGALTRALRDQRFDSTIRAAIAAGEPIPDGTISAAVTNYKNRALRYRAETIARTEAMTSLHEAQSQAVDQAIADGIDRGDIRYTWHATHDDRTRDSHAAMDLETVGEGELFVTGAGNLLEYPGDPNGPPEEVINCRCWREMRVDFLANVE
ncbi:MAG TPA: phage minor head protein, partial [Polyangia bacterium]|nr:phage minor head protein [Polyangia bacterium]